MCQCFSAKVFRFLPKRRDTSDPPLPATFGVTPIRNFEFLKKRGHGADWSVALQSKITKLIADAIDYVDAQLGKKEKSRFNSKFCLAAQPLGACV